MDVQNALNILSNVYYDAISEEEKDEAVKVLSDYVESTKTLRENTIEIVLKKATEIQEKQINNLRESPRRNGKMWATYMNTYLGHVRNACKRLLKEKLYD